ncbi:hypothetical protein HX52_05615 [Salmonella enterica]|nr:hypothetical protein [Salmonella enterica]EBL7696102.1 hypothetical protein [Salmonella enterica]EDU6129899.1 hypothetical protein [Salmonella enterica subsp. enterica]
MSQARDQQAYQRGIWAARKWSRLKDVIMRWDRFCVSMAREYRFPGWIGHIPIAVFTISMLTAFIFGGMFIATSAVLVGAVILLAFPSKAQPPSFRHSEDNEEQIYHDWNRDRFNGREYHPHRYNEWKDDD